MGVAPGAPNPGLGGVTGEGEGDGDGVGLGGVAGLEKLRLPRLPDEPPPPALAQALVSMARLAANRSRTVRTMAAEILDLHLIVFSPSESTN
ncbi:MAG: hypothetical protein WAW37_08705 [Syntrophobacteraceae bacterium]